MQRPAVRARHRADLRGLVAAAAATASSVARRRGLGARHRANHLRLVAAELAQQRGERGRARALGLARRARERGRDARSSRSM